MTRGDEDIEGEGGLRKFSDKQKGALKKLSGGSENLYTSKATGGAPPKELSC